MCKGRVDVIEMVSTTPELPATVIFISPSIVIDPPFERLTIR